MGLSDGCGRGFQAVCVGDGRLLDKWMFMCVVCVCVGMYACVYVFACVL